MNQKKRSMPQIARRIHFHSFRNYAQTRDMIAGMPVSIQCAQREWKPDSSMPMRYARIATGHVDKWMLEHYGSELCNGIACPIVVATL